VITGVVLARNEEAQIAACLASLRPHVDEVILIDMESDDRTIEAAAPWTDRLVRHPRLEQFDAARNVALEHGTHEWFWFLDADERVPDLTGVNVRALVRDRGDRFDALELPFQNLFCGRWIKQAGWWPDYHARILRRGCFHYPAEVHTPVVVTGRTVHVPAEPRFVIVHHIYASLEHYLEKMNRYTSREALKHPDEPADWRVAIQEMMHDLFLHYEQPDSDGAQGWWLAWLSGQYRWLARTKQSARAGSDAPESLEAVLAEMTAALTALRQSRA